MAEKQGLHGEGQGRSTALDVAPRDLQAQKHRTLWLPACGFQHPFKVGSVLALQDVGRHRRRAVAPRGSGRRGRRGAVPCGHNLASAHVPAQIVPEQVLYLLLFGTCAGPDCGRSSSCSRASLRRQAPLHQRPSLSGQPVCLIKPLCRGAYETKLILCRQISQYQAGLQGYAEACVA